jgi:putative transposase
MAIAVNNRYNPNQHRRQSIRLRGWDYTTPGAYFITICTHRRESLLADTRLKAIVENAWLAVPGHPQARHVLLDEWVVMPNHLHGILILTDDGKGEVGTVGAWLFDGAAFCKATRAPICLAPTGRLKPGSIGAIVGNFKSLTARRINALRRISGGPVWQRGYYDRIVRDERELNAIRAYIHDNPRRWAEDRDNLDALFEKMDLM